VPLEEEIVFKLSGWLFDENTESIRPTLLDPQIRFQVCQGKKGDLLTLIDVAVCLFYVINNIVTLLTNSVSSPVHS